MGVLEVQTVATAAVREASNGPEFLETVRSECGLDVRLLTGDREAEVSAGGVLSAIPRASGVAADLGGASLELTLLDTGSVAERVSLPLGTVRGNGGGVHRGQPERPFGTSSTYSTGCHGRAGSLSTW